MKMLLTSAGITNEKIAKSVLELVQQPAKKIRVVYIPTAANAEEGDKRWVIENLNQFDKQGYGSIDIVDIAAVPKKIWLPRLKAANLICFGGGREQYLTKVVNDVGLAKVLPSLLKTRVFMGISAGSMIAGKFLTPVQYRVIYPEDNYDSKVKSLEYVDCVFIPHLNSKYFPTKREEILRKIEGLESTLYGLDDDTALKIIGKKIEVVGDGKHLKIEASFFES